MCTHDHASGDECLAFFLGPDVVESIGRPEAWPSGYVPPLPELVVFGELAQAAAEGRSDVGLDEAAIWLAARVVGVVAGQRRAASPPRRGIAVARWTRRSGWTRTRTSRWTSTARLDRPG
jgi:hypothetical protein